MMVVSFGFFLVFFTLIGIASFSQSKHDAADYLLAGRNVPAWLVGLSAVATCNSGYMFTGMIGFTYAFGWSSVWLMIGWLAGDFLGSLFIHKNLRIATERTEVHTFSGVLSHWNGTNFRALRVVGGVISVLFSGGLRASIWTDAAQSIVMIISMSILLFVAVNQIGTFPVVFQKLTEVQPGYMEWFPRHLPFAGFLGPVLFVLGWFFAGFGVVGQPHVMVRFMAMKKPETIFAARFYYYGWYFLFYAVTIGVGLMARILIPSSGQFDAELALPMLSMDLLHPVLVGLMLAGLFAATMSTADSLILSCSASLTRDLFPHHQKHQFLITKFGTVFVTGLALWIALTGNKSVFQLVLYAWAVLAAAFGPLLSVYCLKQQPNQRLAIFMMLGGTATIFIWKALGWSDVIYEAALGIMAGFIIFGVGKVKGWA